MDVYERNIRQRLKNDFEHYASRCLKIRTKEGSIEPFIFNRAQRYLHEKVEFQRLKTGKVRVIILKGRQQGCSTYVGARIYHKVTHSRGIEAFILTHALDATDNLYKMTQRFYEHCPPIVKPQIKTNNSKELRFSDLDCGYKIGTAENKSVGRSATIQLFHGSECAYWQNAAEHAKGILQAVPDMPGTEVFLESTANGVGNYFFEQWQMAEAGISDFIPVFIPWFIEDKYSRPISDHFLITDEEKELVELYGLSNEQLEWRRYKIIELSTSGQDGKIAFQQEYPNNPVEAFISTGADTFIHPKDIIKARKCEVEIEKNLHPLLIGVDPARTGDRTAIIRREARKAHGLEFHLKKTTMEIVGIVHNIIINENPAKVFIDVVGIGAGIYDRLVEIGHKNVVVAVNGAETALDSKRYANRRAEMWGLMKNWILEQPSSIPDDDSLHADLSGPNAEFDSNGRLLIEKKEKMRKRGIRSPDSADALSFTFYYPVSAFHKSVQKDQIAAKLMSKQRKLNQLMESRSHGKGRK